MEGLIKWGTDVDSVLRSIFERVKSAVGNWQCSESETRQKPNLRDESTVSLP